VLGQELDVHHRIRIAVRVGEPLELGDAALQRDLPALEAGRDVLARPGPFHAATGRLSPDAGTSATNPFAILRRALGGMQVMELHPSNSSTSTRWCTFATIPRTDGVSSLMTESLMRCRPRRRTVTFWSFGRSITLRRCVTFSLLIDDHHHVARTGLAAHRCRPLRARRSELRAAGPRRPRPPPASAWARCRPSRARGAARCR